MHTFWRIFLYFLTWRILLFLPLVAGHYLLPYRIGFDYSNIWKFVRFYKPVESFLLYPWANFDGVHYLSIAGKGYENDQGFFPLFPILIRAVAVLFGGGEPFGISYFFAGFFVANFTFLIALFFLYKLLLIEYDEKVVKKMICFLLVFPTAFFFATIYSESLFLLLTVLSFYFARKKQWVFAGVFGMFLTATRVVGISILPALLFEFFIQKKNLLTKKALSLLLIPLGLLGYMYFNLVNFGDAFSFLEAHTKLGTGRSESIVLFPQTLFRYGKIVLTVPVAQFEWWIALLEFGSFFFAATLLFVAWKKKVRLSYLVFAILSFLLPASSGTFSGLPRYTLVLFPIFIALALVKNKMLRVAYMIFSAILLLLLLMFFSRGFYVA
ncbi:MAG: hypothetical protein HY429_04720 [Candidatus Levybacteria bacterium]|nr:hypothetical protein [Candidatus Levybacteria bacterium]